MPVRRSALALLALAFVGPGMVPARAGDGLSAIPLPARGDDWVSVRPFARTPSYVAFGPRSQGFADGCGDAGTCPIDAAPLTRPATAVAAAGCDPNYAGACVPIARDVDCAGKGGDGPVFVQGPFEVIGDDIYNLDADDDGIACEPLYQ